MSQPPDLDPLLLDDYDDQDIFNSPEKTRTQLPERTPSRHGRHDIQEARDAALSKELENVKAVNKVVEDVINGLTKAKGNMDTVHTTIQSASTLLNTWTRILSQTEHNQRLILDPNWQGATQDLEYVETEALRRQQAAERRTAEDQARREAAARRAEEEEARQITAPSSSSSSSRGARGGRGRGTTTSRLTSASSNAAPGYVGVGGQGGRGRGSARAGSAIGRGTVRGTRGRGLS